MKIFLNPEDRITKEIQEALEENGGFCPCAVEKTPETKCLCKAFRDQIKRKESGMCHCGLWGVSFEEDEKK